MNTPIKSIHLLLLFCLFSISLLCAQESPSDSIALIKQNYINATINEDKGKEALLKLLSTVPPELEVSDQNVIELQQLYPISSQEINYLVKNMGVDGSWSDINYQDTKSSGWEPKIHAERILKLTKYYYKEKNQLKMDELSQIKNTIHQAMFFWFNQNLICKNWWYNQIGIPRTLGPAFLLFEQEMSTQEKEDAIKVMMKSSFGMTGQNKVWLAGNVLIRALLQKNWNLLKEAQQIICSEIVLGQEEGIKDDWSFHQHGAQQQFGNYGLSYICNMSFYSEIFAKTSLTLSLKQQQILTSLLLEGYQWIIWRGYWDVNALNRQLFRNADIDKGFILLFAAYSLIKSSEPEVVENIKKMIDWNFLFSQLPNSFIGNKYFGESNYTIHRTAQWMASLRMASNRVIGVESMNGDNIKGYYMADGALYTYTRGDEYHNIFPFWNWRRIPGITTYESDVPIPNPNRKSARNASSYVGGISNGKNGITAMQLKRNGLTAHKSWIFTNDYVLCMGSNIHSDSTATILTSIDQRFRRGKIWSYHNERFFNDNTGYIVLKADTCIMSIDKKQGQWHDFMGMYKPVLLENNIFSIYLKHRKDQPASYIYLVLPGSSKKIVRNFNTSDIIILRNDKDIQAVIINETCYAATYQKDVDLKLPSGEILHMSQAGTYIVDVQSEEILTNSFKE